MGLNTPDHGTEIEYFASASGSVGSRIRGTDEEIHGSEVNGDPLITFDPEAIRLEALRAQGLAADGGAEGTDGLVDDSVSDSNVTDTTGYASIEGECKGSRTF